MRNYGCFILLLMAINCVGQQDKPTGRDVRVFKDTPVFEVAVAIRDQNIAELNKLLKGKSSEFINYREKYYGQSLLNWAVYRDNYESAKILVENGADPNLKGYDSTSAIIHAADKIEKKYLELLLIHGGNPNAIADIDAAQHLRTPLMAASFKSLENVKLLIESGANPNYIHVRKKDLNGQTVQSALTYALDGKRMEIVKYLIIDVGVDFLYPLNVTPDGEKQYILKALREIVFPLDTDNYRIKMEIVDYLKTRGQDYWKEPIPEYYKRQYDKAFLDKY